MAADGEGEWRNARRVDPGVRGGGVAEACSWAALLAGMAVKYGPPGDEIGVKIFGPIHGALFVVYGLLALVVARRRRWTLVQTGLALASAVPPFATVLFERWASRRGLLDAPAVAQRPLTPRAVADRGDILGEEPGQHGGQLPGASSAMWCPESIDAARTSSAQSRQIAAGSP